MKTKLFALITSGILMIASSVSAQTSTTGAVKGVITDQATGEPVAGATVVVTSPALQGSQAEITSADGSYFISNLPPGTYQLTVYYSDSETRRGNVLVQLGKVAAINQSIDTQAQKGEVIEIEGRVPVIDQGSTKTGRTITEDFTQNIPTGRTFGAVLGAAAGSQDDLYGVSFGGSTSAENIYIIEGINTTDPAYGLQSTNLPNEFIQETELITGGYNAEYGRSTGGVVNVLTKSGGNEFHGTVFSYFTPGALEAAEELTPRAGSAIEGNRELSYDLALGAELGGPIVKDKLWFHVGISPSFRQFDTHRIVSSLVDADNDGDPDTDPDTGFTVFNEVGRTTYSNGTRTTFFTAKVSGAVSPEHQGSVSFFGNPTVGERYLSVTGSESANRIKEETGAWDMSGKWTSKFNNNKTQVDAVVGWHRNLDRDYPAVDGGDNAGFTVSLTRPLTAYMQYEQQAAGGIPDECLDGSPSDQYANLVNCPVTGYRTGGLGFRELETTDRLSAMISATQRVNLAGQHILKAGFDAEHQTYDKLTAYTGGERYQLANLGSNFWVLDRRYSFIDPSNPVVAEHGGVADMCSLDGGATYFDCVYWPNGQPATTNTRNFGAYLQDSWQVLPNLTVNAGVRWEQQSLLAAQEVAGTLSPVTNEPFAETAITISDMVAPRLGVIYDPTQEGRSKVYTHWGRFYESIPMDINARAFGGDVTNRNYVRESDCPAELTPENAAECGVDKAILRRYLGGGDTLVIPGLQGQFVDELVLGGEYEVLNDLKLGASYIHRNLGRAIEDLSTDGGNTYFIANPGVVDEDAVAGDPNEDILLATADFDKPTRTYNALVVTAEKRFSREVMLIASYTLSRLQGNFPGLFSPETGQLDPNLTSMYDLPELMANRTGPLSADRTHLLKLDGFYQLNLAQIGYFVFGGSVRATSGIPHNFLGAHPIYGDEESYILPRGAGERSPLTTQFDVRVQYGRQLNKNMRLEAFLDVFNLFNQQAELDADDEYTGDPVNPIVGGSEEDLAHLKIVGSGTAASQNPNFGNVSARQSPLSMRFGLRLTF